MPGVTGANRLPSGCRDSGGPGMQFHVVYDPGSGDPRRTEITPATVNDVQVGKAVPIEPGATYVFDKAYCHYGWWSQLHAAKSFFVTRNKTNATYRVTRRRKLRKHQGDGSRIQVANA